MAHRGGQGEGVAVVVQQGGLLPLRDYLGQIAWIMVNFTKRNEVDG